MLLVRNLSRNVTDAHLREIFGHCGFVQRAKVFSGANGSKSHAEVEFQTRRVAFEAIDVFDGAEVDGLVVRVVFGGPGPGSVPPPPPPPRWEYGRRGPGPGPPYGHPPQQHRPPPDGWRDGWRDGGRRGGPPPPARGMPPPPPPPPHYPHSRRSPPRHRDERGDGRDGRDGGRGGARSDGRGRHDGWEPHASWAGRGLSGEGPPRPAERGAQLSQRLGDGRRDGHEGRDLDDGRLRGVTSERREPERPMRPEEPRRRVEQGSPSRRPSGSSYSDSP